MINKVETVGEFLCDYYIIMNAYSSVPWVQGLKNIMNRIVPTEPTTFNKLLCISKPIKPPSCVKKITEYRDFTVGKN